MAITSGQDPHKNLFVCTTARDEYYFFKLFPCKDILLAEFQTFFSSPWINADYSSFLLNFIVHRLTKNIAEVQV